MAIAFDAFNSAAGQATSPPSNTVTFNHTCTGSNLILLVGVYCSSSNTINSVKYNGVSMTVLDTATASSPYVKVFYLIAPATGSNNVVITFSASATVGYSSISFTGVDQTLGVNAPIHPSKSGSGSQTLTETLVTSYDNSYIADFFIGNQTTYSSSNPAAGGSQTQKTSVTNIPPGWDGQSYRSTTTAGSYSLTWAWNHIATAVGAAVCVEIIPTSTFPIARTPTTTAFATSATSMSVNMPPVVASNDLLIALVEVRNSGTWTKPTSWNDISTVSQAGGGSVGQLNGFYKIADGTEGGGTVTWTAGTSTTAEWQVIRITNWNGTTPPEGTTSSGDATNADPPNESPSWGSADNLWIAVAANSATGETTGFTAAPTNYNGLLSSGTSSGGSTSNVATAIRQLTASSDNPGTFTPNSNRFWAAATIAVEPVAAATTTSTSTSTSTSTTSSSTSSTSSSSSTSSTSSSTSSTSSSSSTSSTSSSSTSSTSSSSSTSSTSSSTSSTSSSSSTSSTSSSSSTSSTSSSTSSTSSSSSTSSTSSSTSSTSSSTSHTTSSSSTSSTSSSSSSSTSSTSSSTSSTSSSTSSTSSSSSTSHTTSSSSTSSTSSSSSTSSTSSSSSTSSTSTSSSTSHTTSSSSTSTSTSTSITQLTTTSTSSTSSSTSSTSSSTSSTSSSSSSSSSSSTIMYKPVIDLLKERQNLNIKNEKASVNISDEPKNLDVREEKQKIDVLQEERGVNFRQ